MQRLNHARVIPGASAHWYDIAFQSGWIAAAIPALVVVAHNRRGGGQGWVPSDQVSANVWVTPHDFQLVLTQRSGLVEDVISDSRLSYVVLRALSLRRH